MISKKYVADVGEWCSLKYLTGFNRVRLLNIL